VIISDIGMPKMSGLEFYRNAVALNPTLKRQFMFVSGDVAPETRSFLQANHLLCLEKPFSLKRLAGLVREIMEKTL
jgi:CheY-like chemotaxis protein